MSRAIDADKVEKWSWQEPKYSDSINDRTDLRDFLRSLPTLSPDDARPVGKWIEVAMRIKCSVCGTDFSDEVTCCSNCYRWPWNYCPNCGAKMEVTADA